MSLALLLVLGTAIAADPHPSYHKLVSSNGRGVVVLNGDNGSGPVLDLFSDHLYKQYQPDQEETRDLLYDTYFGIGCSRGQGWLTEARAYDYEHGTGILAIDRSSTGIAVTEYAFAPLDLPAPGFVHLFRVENLQTAAEELHVYSLHNFHLGQDTDGDGADDDGEAIWMEGDTLSEWGAATGLGMRFIPLTPPASYGCDQVWSTVNTGATLPGTCGTADARWEGDDKVGALQWDSPLAPGETAWFGTVQAFFSDWDSGDVRSTVEAWRAGRDAETLLTDERAAWAAWLAEGAAPDGMSDDERAVYEQQLVFLKMGQVAEEGAAHGQILASLPLSAGSGGFSHTWNIAWVRDGAYAIRALTAAGHLQEAGDALAFLLQDKAGGYRDYVNGDDYSVSLCRCYGDGSEWSDEDENGPNIEFDDFGLTLWALGAWVAAGGSLEALGIDVDGVVFHKLANVLMGLREQEVFGEGLLPADSSIWERHWNGHQKHFTYSSVWAVAGLRAAQDLWTLWTGDERPHHDIYRMRATEIRDAACAWLRDGDGALSGNLEELTQGWGYDDLAAVDAFSNGALDAAGATAAASFTRWEEHLAVPSGHGFKRNDDGDTYDEQEWVMVDLRLAEAYRRACRPGDAQALEDWITQQALQNHWTIPELMHPETGDYEGPAPMMGFGAGLYVLAMHTRAEAAADCADGVGFDCDAGPDDTGAPDDTQATDDTQAPDDSEPTDDTEAPDDTGDGREPGCGCAGFPLRFPPALLLLALPLLARRRP
ncbi:MAG: hypothetical protein ABIO70_02610 [Pseudomonadota bacterium]